MFYYISGNLAALEPTFAVLDTAGVGYKMTISQSTYDAMPPHLSVKEPPFVKLYSYMAIREDDIELFGFFTLEELSAFKMLITVSGVGPKAAISILSTLTPTKLAIAVCTDDKKAISKASGIGPKTAARIILELKDKLKNEFEQMEIDDGTLRLDSSNVSNQLSDAADALAVLGYSKNEAMSALRGIDTEKLGLDEIIKQALKKLMKN